MEIFFTQCHPVLVTPPSQLEIFYSALYFKPRFSLFSFWSRGGGTPVHKTVEL